MSFNFYKIVVAFFILTASNLLNAQSKYFYSIDSIQEIRIYFDQPNWDYLMDTAKAGTEETYLMAKKLIVNGESFDSVGVKYKGNSTYKANNAKNPLHIELNTYKKQKYNGVTDIKLSNVWADPSFVREALSYELLRNYMHAPRANFAKIYINDNYYGLMTNQEHIGDDFLNDHFHTSYGVTFKCNPVSIGGTSGLPTLVYKGKDSVQYYKTYELRSNYGWNRLIQFMDTLNNYPAYIEKVLDVDKALWMAAFNNLFVNLDSYSGSFSQNYYLYEDKNNRFCPIVWDLNMSFASFTATGTTPASVDTTTAKNLTINLHATNAQRPMISKLLSVPTYKKMYVAHIKTMVKEVFETNLFIERGLAMQDLIEKDVIADKNKFYADSLFRKNLYNSVRTSTGGMGGGSLSGIRNLMVGRVNYYNTTTEFKGVAPEIGAPVISPAKPLSNQPVYITSTITGTATNVLLGYREDRADIFTKTKMFDDGLHGDGAANDGVFGVSIIPTSSSVQYYVYAENNDAGIFSPQRAEFEYHKFDLNANPPKKGEVVINELLADNLNGQKNLAGKNEDWIELYNTTNTDLDLGGCYLSDDRTKKSKYQFSNPTIIKAKGYLIIWADEDKNPGEVHANFKLSKSGEELIFTQPDSTTILDSLTFGKQTTDITWGRYPNGTGPFQELQPTFAAMNFRVSNVEIPLQGVEIQVYPNPAHGLLTIKSSVAVSNLKIWNIFGQLVESEKLEKSTTYQKDISGLPIGLYFIQCDNSNIEKIVIE